MPVTVLEYHDSEDVTAYAWLFVRSFRREKLLNTAVWLSFIMSFGTFGIVLVSNLAFYDKNSGKIWMNEDYRLLDLTEKRCARSHEIIQDNARSNT